MDIAIQNNSIAELLTSFGNSQAMLEQIIAAIEAKKTKAKKDILVAAVKEDVTNKAKAFGQDEKTALDIVEKYSTIIRKIEQDYCTASSIIAEKKIKSEEDELTALACIGIYNRKIEKNKQTDAYKSWESAYKLKLESAYAAREIGDFETYRKRMEGVKEFEKKSPIYADLKARSITMEEVKRERDMQKILYRQQSDLAAKRDTVYSNAGIEYKKSMIKSKTPNIFKKMFELVTSKFSGKRRFETAIEPVKNIIEYIKQGEENFVQNTSTMLDISIDKIRDGTTNFVDLVKTMPEKTRKKVNEIVSDFKTKTNNPVESIDKNLALEK